MFYRARRQLESRLFSSLPVRDSQKKVAIVGARYGDLKVEQRILGRLGVELAEGMGSQEEEIVSVCTGADVILCGGAPKISASVLGRLPQLKAVVRFGIGVDTVDLAECTRRGIYVANVPDYCIDEVATHALALILAWARKLPVSHRSVGQGQWQVTSLKPLQSAQDQVLGLLGFGRIAQSLCRMARAIGFQVWARDAYVQATRIRARGAKPVSLKRLVRGSDFISLHLPLTAKTRHIIDQKMLAEMKPTSYLINTARGELVDGAALSEALKNGAIAGAALDVLEEEPPPLDHPLRSMDNVIITPHCAWYTERSQKVLREKACAEVIRVLRGGIPKNVVNREVLGYIEGRKS
jgi:D-3-phosphoglycerate dehydrogenase